ncbi:MAG: DUF3592 domain-containing protein [Geminicoccales bacterium]
MSGDEQALLIIVAIYFSLAGLASLVFQLRILSWPMINGILVHAKISRWGVPDSASEQNYEVNVKYLYQVDGKQYDGYRLSPWHIFASGILKFLLRIQLKGITELSTKEVAVFYNPSAPEKSYLIKPGKVGLSITAAMVVIPGIFLIFHV